MSKRESILSAALQMLTSQGIHATPMSAIAKAAGTGMGTIYNYFKNKEILINEIYCNIKEQEEALLPAVSEGLPIRSQFEKYYRDTVSFFLENPLFFHFMEQLQASPIITQESKDRGYQAVNSVIDLLESGKEQRIIKDIPTRELMQFIGGTILSFLRHHLAEDRSLQPALTHQMRMVWDALKE